MTIPHGPPPPVDAAEWLAGYSDRLDELRERALRAREAVDAIDVSVTSDDGTVTATVGAGGTLQRLELSGRSRVGPVLAATIVTTIAAAHREAGLRATALLEPVIGDRGVTALRAYLPAEGPG